MGNGRQYVPWISMPDWLNAVELLLDREDVQGPVNLTGPTPVRNAELATTLARQLHRPALFPVPTLVLRAVVGELASDATASQRVLPGVLNTQGFEFAYPTVDDALRWALGR
jgi:NAD dependent epimerase/dehydratase family enzyme